MRAGCVVRVARANHQLLRCRAGVAVSRTNMLVKAECCYCHVKFDLEVDLRRPPTDGDYIVGYACRECAEREGKKPDTVSEDSGDTRDG